MTASSTREAGRLPPGTVLDDRFEIADFLGAGNFGAVYRARQLIFGHPFREVALKLFKEGLVTAANAYEVLNDAIIVVGLMEEKHSPEIAAHLVQVYDMGMLRTPASQAFLSMKLIPGRKTLKSEVYRYRHLGGMPPALSLRYLRELLLPLAWMHGLETPVVHGDLKPDNVMMTEDSHLILVDFGLAAHMPLGVSGGDIAYNAPEKLLGLNGGPEADMYSLGLVWYELLTGQHPFAGVGAEALARGDSDGYAEAQRAARQWPIAPLDPNIPAARQQRRIRPASELNPELGREPQLELLLEQCLADDISRRPANARVLLDKIDAYLANGTLTKSDLEVIGRKPAADPPVADGNRPRSVDLRLADATALLHQRKFQPALAAVEAVLATSPQSVAALLLKIRILLAMSGHLPEASATCEQVLGLAPGDPAVFEAMADLRIAQGKPTQAVGFRCKAAELRLRAVRAG